MTSGGSRFESAPCAVGTVFLQQSQRGGVVEVSLQPFLLPSGELPQTDAQLDALFLGVQVVSRVRRLGRGS